MAKYKCLTDNYENFFQGCVYEENELTSNKVFSVSDFVRIHPDKWKLEKEYPKKMKVWDYDDNHSSIETVYGYVSGIHHPYITADSRFSNAVDYVDILELPEINGYKGIYDKVNNIIEYGCIKFDYKDMVKIIYRIKSSSHGMIDSITIKGETIGIKKISSVLNIIKKYRKE